MNKENRLLVTDEATGSSSRLQDSMKYTSNWSRKTGRSYYVTKQPVGLGSTRMSIGYAKKSPRTMAKTNKRLTRAARPFIEWSI